MSMTRRTFGLKTGGTVALTVLGVQACGDHSDNPSGQSTQRSPHHLQLPNRPFHIGHPDQYRQAGVHAQFRQSHGVWLATRKEGFLVALSAVCPHHGCGTQFDEHTQQFVCPCHNSRYDIDGLVQPHSISQRSLERCKIELTGRYGDADRRLIINPTIRFRQEKNEWSSAGCMYYFDQPEPIGPRKRG